MNYIKKHLKWIIIFVVLLVVLGVSMIFGGKEEPIKEKETTPQETTVDTGEKDTSGNNRISIESEDPYDDEEWLPIVYE